MLWIPLLAILAVINLIGCSNKEELPPTVTLEADKTTIKANGRDSLTFTVKVNGRVETRGVSVRTDAGESASSSLRYAATKAGSHTFYAVYEGTKSNVITVSAAHLVVTLRADRDSIRANGTDRVRFTVTADDEDVTADAVITRRGETETKLDGRDFTTEQSGQYTFYATYREERSEEVTVRVAAESVTLIADRQSIRADGREAVTFTVRLGSRDVTDRAVIMRRATPDAPINGRTFTTSQYGDYAFYAIYDGARTADLNLVATPTSLKFVKQHCIMQFTSTTCSTCPLMTTAIDRIATGTPGLAVPIVFHVKALCFNTPALYGVLAETADRLCPVWPSSLVDMHQKVNIYRSGTGEKLNEAIWQMNTYAPAQTGIGLRSVVEGGVIRITADVVANKTEEYRLFAFVVEDGIKHGQRVSESDTGDNPNYIHNHVATYPLTATDDARTGLSLGTLERGRKLTRTFTIDPRTYAVPRKVDLSRCHIVAYTLRLIDGAYTIDNVATCAVSGGSVAIRYAK